MIIPDHELKKLCHEYAIIEPHPEEVQFQPASIDVRLGGHFLLPRRYLEYDEQTLEEGKKFVLHPGRFVLATTKEKINLPPDISARVEGRSTHARKGLLSHAAAGWIDPGFHGQITLELVNAGPWVIELEVGERIAQVAFMRMASAAKRLYGQNMNKYQHQQGTVGVKEDLVK